MLYVSSHRCLQQRMCFDGVVEIIVKRIGYRFRNDYLGREMQDRVNPVFFYKTQYQLRIADIAGKERDD